MFDIQTPNMRALLWHSSNHFVHKTKSQCFAKSPQKAIIKTRPDNTLSRSCWTVAEKVAAVENSQSSLFNRLINLGRENQKLKSIIEEFQANSLPDKSTTTLRVVAKPPTILNKTMDSTTDTDNRDPSPPHHPYQFLSAAAHPPGLPVLQQGQRLLSYLNSPDSSFTGFKGHLKRTAVPRVVRPHAAQLSPVDHKCNHLTPISRSLPTIHHSWMRWIRYYRSTS